MQLTPIASNMTEVETSEARILFSYRTPVAAYVFGEGFVRTEKWWSVTTSRHINKWIGKDVAVKEVAQTLPRQLSLGGYNEYIKRNLSLHPYHHSIMNSLTLDEYKALCEADKIKIGQDLSDEVDNLPWDDYEGNLLNYFCGMTPQESRKFNKMKRDHGVK